MAALLAWRDSWLLGIEPLDADHLELVRLVNRLIEAAQTRPPASRCSHTHARIAAQGLQVCLQRLIDHLRKHFAAEEAFLQEIGYPGIAEHESEHALLLAELVDLQRRLVASGAERIDEDDLELVRDWFLNHVVTEDRRFASHYYRGLGAGTDRGRRAILGVHEAAPLQLQPRAAEPPLRPDMSVFRSV